MLQNQGFKVELTVIAEERRLTMNPAMSLTYEGEKPFLNYGKAKIEIAVPYTPEAVRRSLGERGFRGSIIDDAIVFLERIRADFQRPDILAVA